MPAKGLETLTRYDCSWEQYQEEVELTGKGSLAQLSDLKQNTSPFGFAYGRFILVNLFLLRYNLTHIDCLMIVYNVLNRFPCKGSTH